MTATSTQQNEPGERLRDEGWKHVWPKFRLAAGLIIVSILLVGYLYGLGTYFLVITLFVTAAYVAEAVGAIREYRRTWIVGARAEVQVSRRLKVLESRGWRTLHSIEKPEGGDIDHIAWGPRGLFVIETKANRGRVGIESGVLTYDGNMPERNAVDQAYHNAMFVKGHVERALGRRQWVVAVVCLTKAFLEGYQLDIGSPRRVHVVKLERLMEFLEKYGDTTPLSAQQTQEIDGALQQLAGRSAD